MDFGRKVVISMQKRLPQLSFNPCFDGSGIERLVQATIELINTRSQSLL